MPVAEIDDSSIAETLLPAYRVLREGLLGYYGQVAFLPIVPSCHWLISQLTPPCEELARRPDDLLDRFAVAVVVFGLQRPIIARSPERLHAIENFLTRAWPITSIPGIEDLEKILELTDIYASGAHPYLWCGVRSLVIDIPKWPKEMACVALSSIHHFFASPLFPRPLVPFALTNTANGIDGGCGAPSLAPNDYVTTATLIRVVTNAVKVALDVASESWALAGHKPPRAAAPVRKRFIPAHEPTFIPRPREG